MACAPARAIWPAGFRTRYSDSTSVYLEEKYTHGDVPTGLIHSTGVEIAPFDRFNFGANVDFGTLTRSPDRGRALDEQAAGVRAGYGVDRLTWPLRWSIVSTTSSNRTTTFLRNARPGCSKTASSISCPLTGRLLGKLNYADSKSSLGGFYDGKYTEAVLGYGYRPVITTA